MTTFQVDSDAVLGATGSIHASMERLSGESSALLGQLVGLQGSWTGTASAAFQTVVADWRATQARVEESLGSIGRALGSAAQQYAEAETSNTGLFRQ
ncbi:MAG TPA: WXG100 family type VII secretion target [Galbitalea sp.]|jgi:WXG100 family type VII secretion target|nr:WXG100 family type VII secretion target [Galbitalea sp.]